MLLLPFFKTKIMTRFIEVTLKSGNKITVSESEIPGLREAGLLKENKQKSETKEFKDKAETKERTTKEIAEANENMASSKKRPANIGLHSIKGSRPKKT